MARREQIREIIRERLKIPNRKRKERDDKIAALEGRVEKLEQKA